ncbi:MAG TPA: hypothetical protein VF813_07535 [Anaerolineaceae bacterium]
MSALIAKETQNVLGGRKPARPQAVQPAGEDWLTSGLSNARRLIVLIPGGDLDETGLACRIWNMAVSGQIEKVLYLTLVTDERMAQSMVRRLANLASTTRDPRFDLETKVDMEKSWNRAITAVARPGDLILIQAGQMERKRIWGHEKIEGALATLGLPTCLLEGFFRTEEADFSSSIRAAAQWLIFLALIGFFLFLQGSVERFEHGWIEVALQIVLLSLELGLIWLANGPHR